MSPSPEFQHYLDNPISPASQELLTISTALPVLLGTIQDIDTRKRLYLLFQNAVQQELIADMPEGIRVEACAYMRQQTQEQLN